MASDLEQARASLVEVQAQISRIQSTANEYKVPGSIEVKFDLELLFKQETRLRRRIRMLQGVPMRNRADFSSEVGIDDTTTASGL